MYCELYLKTPKKNLILIYILFISKLSKKLGISCTLQFLPTKISKISLLKSPHVHKKAKEHFEVRYYKAVLKFSFLKNLNFIKSILNYKPLEISSKIIINKI